MVGHSLEDEYSVGRIGEHIEDVAALDVPVSDLVGMGMGLLTSGVGTGFVPSSVDVGLVPSSVDVG